MNIDVPNKLSIKKSGPVELDYGVCNIITTKHLYNLYSEYLICDNKQVFFIEDNSVEPLEAIIRSISSTLDRTLSGEYEFSMLVGFGGGKVIDVTKYIATRLHIQYVVIPTTLSNDGICSPVAVLRKEGKHFRTGVFTPHEVFIPLEVIKQAPTETIVSGIGDLLSNISALQDWELAHQVKGEPINYFAHTLSYVATYHIYYYLLYKDRLSLDFLEALARSLISSGLAMEISGNSRPCSGGEHLFSHAIDTLYPENTIPHGHKVAFGTLLTESLRGKQIEAIQLSHIYKEVGLPFTYYRLLGDANKLVKAILHVTQHNKQRYSIFHERIKSESDAKRLIGKF